MEVKYNITLVSLIGCISIYGITSSLLTPLISIILEHRKVDTTIIGIMAMVAPAGLIIGAFFVSRIMRNLAGRKLLIFGIVFEILLVFALINTKSIELWFLIRFFGGFADSILFVVTETWLMEITSSKKRGRIMGFYNSIMMMSFALGPLILSISGSKGILPFLICIILMIFAGLPLLLTGSYSPSHIEKPSFNVVSFMLFAPLLALACFVVAFQDLAITSLMPVYGLRVGMSESSATLMLFFGVAGGALLQFPIGWAADRFGTRRLLVVCSLVGLIGTLVWPFVISKSFLLWSILFLWWGFFAGVSTISMILAGNWFKGSELSTAMAALGFFWGIGAFIGPFLGAAMMDLWNPFGFPLILIIVSGVFFVVSLVPWFYKIPEKRNT